MEKKKTAELGSQAIGGSERLSTRSFIITRGIISICSTESLDNSEGNRNNRSRAHTPSKRDTQIELRPHSHLSLFGRLADDVKVIDVDHVETTADG